MMFDQLPSKNRMFDALSSQNSEYNGRFWYGVKSTGIFCKPGCPARQPNRENVEFFASTTNALAAGYRPCKRCHPLHSNNTPETVKNILAQVEQNLFYDWSNGEIQEYGIEPDHLKRWFKKNHKVTFSNYLQMRRLDKLLGQLKYKASSVASNESSSHTFQETIAKILNQPAGKSSDTTNIYLNRIPTPLGLMLAGTGDEGLYLLEFIDRSRHEKQLHKIAAHNDCTFVPGSNEIMDKVVKQVDQYFNGTRKKFSIPIIYSGTDFQQNVWQALQTIPYGHTRAYQEQAEQIGDTKAVRAVAGANGKNRISIIIPCHRVIGKDGTLTGYGGGLWRKKYLLNLEQAHV